MNLRLKITLTTEMTLLFLIIIVATEPSAKGLEWSSENCLTANIAWDVNPSIIQAMDDSIWVVWVSDREAGQNDLYYTTSSNGGLNWSPDTQLTTNSSSDQAPSIMQAADGTIWVAWSSYRTSDYEIWYKTSSDGGLKWSNATQLTTNSSRDMAPSIMQAADRTIWVVWHRDVAGQSDLYYKTSCNGGLNWSPDTQLTTNSSWDQSPSIVQTRNGTIWVAWSSYRTSDYEIWYKTSSDGGLKWSNATQLTTASGFDQSPSIIQAVDDSIWIFWASDRPGGMGATYDLYYKNSSNFGSTWSSDFQLTTNQKDDVSPSATSAIDGSIWVVWSSLRTGDFEIWYKTSDSIAVQDVAIIGVTPSATAVNQSEMVFISVVAENQGTRRETFNVTVYTNLIPLKPKGVTLNPRKSMNLTFLWNTSSVVAGAYNISAEADVVDGEVDIADNTYVDGTVTVTSLDDIAVVSVVPSEGQAYPTWKVPLNITVTVKNNGGTTPTFNVTAYYNTTGIETQTVADLVPGVTKNLTFSWNLSDVAYGNYTISAEVVLPIEVNPGDNVFTDGTVRVKMPGDVDGDRKVGFGDVFLVADAYASKPGDANWDPNCDFDHDDKVGFMDVFKLADYYYKKY